MGDSFILFGGTFDPIHKGHLLVARNALRELDADKVIFVPAKNPRWKVPLDSEHRLHMLQLGLEGEKNFEISMCEMESQAPVSYSIDTVRHYRKLYPNSRIYFLMGFDQLDRLDDWHDAADLGKDAQIVAYARPGFPKNHEAVKKYHVQVIEYADLVDLSSTDIRACKSLMTKKSVIDYIISHDLYFAKTVQGYYDAKRYRHAVSVANLCYDIAVGNHMEPTKAFQAGYLHDIGKLQAKDPDAPRMMKRYFPKYQKMPQWAWHQFLGEMIARYFFGIHGRQVLDAIEFHTTGNAHMGKYGKAVFVGDKLDPLRGYDSSDAIALSKADINAGFALTLAQNQAYLKSAGKWDAAHQDPLSKACYSAYLKK